jgi:hypothetical protein
VRGGVTKRVNARDENETNNTGFGVNQYRCVPWFFFYGSRFFAAKKFKLKSLKLKSINLALKCLNLAVYTMS